MFKRAIFWLGGFLGAVSVFAALSRQRTRPQAITFQPLLNLAGEAVVVCDAAGAIVSLNAVAQEWFGPDGSAARLCYPSGQPVPPGQIPLTRALRTGKAADGAGYLCVSSGGVMRALDVSARPLENGGAAAVFRDITALHERQMRQTETERRDAVLRRLCQKLTAAIGPEELARGVAEAALALVQPLPQTQVRLYAYHAERRELTRLASAPEDRPKRPRSQKASQTPTFPFDAGDAVLWPLYVAREPFRGQNIATLGEMPAASYLALPLIAGGAAIGHLSLSSSDPQAFAASMGEETLALLASLAALALAGPAQAAQATHLADQVAAVREVAGAVSEQWAAGALADLVARHARRVLGAEVCTVAVRNNKALRLLGEGYRDALSAPERYAADAPALTVGAAEKAARTRKPVSQSGLLNPALGSGPWRAFAGQSGRHSVLAVPLPGGVGALTVYRAGESPFSAEQTRFLETLAALTAAVMPPATSPEDNAGFDD